MPECNKYTDLSCILFHMKVISHVLYNSGFMFEDVWPKGKLDPKQQ